MWNYHTLYDKATKQQKLQKQQEMYIKNFLQLFILKLQDYFNNTVPLLYSKAR